MRQLRTTSSRSKSKKWRCFRKIFLPSIPPSGRDGHLVEGINDTGMVGEQIEIGESSDEDKLHRQILKVKAITRGVKRTRICPGSHPSRAPEIQ